MLFAHFSLIRKSDEIAACEGRQRWSEVGFFAYITSKCGIEARIFRNALIIHFWYTAKFGYNQLLAFFLEFSFKRVPQPLEPFSVAKMLEWCARYFGLFDAKNEKTLQSCAVLPLDAWFHLSLLHQTVFCVHNATKYCNALLFWPQHFGCSFSFCHLTHCFLFYRVDWKRWLRHFRVDKHVSCLCRAFHSAFQFSVVPCVRYSHFLSSNCYVEEKHVFHFCFFATKVPSLQFLITVFTVHSVQSFIFHRILDSHWVFKPSVFPSFVDTINQLRNNSRVSLRYCAFDPSHSSLS